MKKNITMWNLVTSGDGMEGDKELVKENRMSLKITLWDKKKSGNFLEFSMDLKYYEARAGLKREQTYMKIKDKM